MIFYNILLENHVVFVLLSQKMKIIFQYHKKYTIHYKNH